MRDAGAPADTSSVSNTYTHIIHSFTALHARLICFNLFITLYFDKLTAANGKYSHTESTRSSADADNRLDAFSGQSRSTNMVPFHM